MKPIFVIERLQLLNILIEQEKTGSPDELSRRLGISRRHLFRLLEWMKDLGVDIWYDKANGTYVNKGEVMLKIEVKLEVKGKNEHSR
ncbi:MAG TPA: hypothetical protein DDY13_03490 [Cytophagales bacterium]|mgnify:CR=1 FL=1|jgi:biotin operon repressor|nr:hypothetical protein [Cytophagales bacterium]